MPFPALCTHCTQIPFSALRLPTTSDLIACAAGAPPTHQWPFRSTTSFHSGRDGGYPTWRLGLRSRVAASTCLLCTAITRMVEEHEELRQMLDVPDLREAWVGAWIEPVAWLGPLPEGEEKWRARLRRLCIVWCPYDAEQGETELAPGEMDGQPRASWVVAPCCFQTEGGGERHFGGRMRGPMVDVRMVKGWMRRCLEGHAKACVTHDGTAAAFQARVLRLIDVHSQRLVEIPSAQTSNIQYTALSYVWGTRQRLVLQTTNLEALQCPGALTGTVARTIQDAMHFTALLAFHFLWVDALCIIQDDDADKADQIGHMSTIYSHAVVTLIAAAGADSEAGLPGVRAPRHDTATQARIPTPDEEITLLTMLDVAPRRVDAIGIPRCGTNPLANTAWDTRGWTLQERELSGRMVVFNDAQVSWKCALHAESEETNTASAIASFAYDDNAPSQLGARQRVWYALDEPGQQLWYKLRTLVLDFSGRRLTVAGDGQDAFAAVLRLAQRLSGELFVWGMPASRFELALCWEPSRKGLVRREETTTLKTTSLNRRVSFPSWSWLGWIGKVSLRVEDRHVEEGLWPETRCYVLRNMPLRLVPMARLSMDAGRGATIKSQSPWAVSLYDISEQIAELTRSRLEDTPDDQLVLFWTESAMFCLSPPNKLAVNDGASYHPWTLATYDYRFRHVLDKHGAAVGKTSGSDGAAPKYMGESPSTQDVNHEFILLASQAPDGHPPKKVALQIERRDGIAYRVNVAEIDEDAWRAAAPQKKLIALG